MQETPTNRAQQKTNSHGWLFLWGFLAGLLVAVLCAALVLGVVISATPCAKFNCHLRTPRCVRAVERVC